METIYLKKIKELEKTKSELERKLKVKVMIDGKKVTIEGDAIDEYTASLVLEAIKFGFTVKIALTLVDSNIIFRTINIKNHTRRKKLEDIKARIIGTEGKTKRAIENIANCEIILQDNTVGIIASADDIESVMTAIINLIRGSKQANVYRYLEEMNRYKKIHGEDLEDLGLKTAREKISKKPKKNTSE